MKHRFSVAALFATLAFGLATPATAAPVTMARDLAQPAATTNPVEQVQHRWRDRDQRRYHRGERWRGHRAHRPDRRWQHRHHRRHYRAGPGIHFHFGAPPVYRRYVEPRRAYRYRLSQAHYDWCQARYRSYRASDNTFQPYNGPRRQCRSPYS